MVAAGPGMFYAMEHKYVMVLPLGLGTERHYGTSYRAGPKSQYSKANGSKETHTLELLALRKSEQEDSNFFTL